MKTVNITQATASQLNWLVMSKTYGTSDVGFYTNPGFRNWWNGNGYYWPSLAGRKLCLHEDPDFLLDAMFGWGIEWRWDGEQFCFTHPNIEGAVLDSSARLGILRTLALVHWRGNEVQVPDALV